MAKSPIAEHKKDDVIEGREYLLKIIRDKKTTYKEGVEAVKLLFRSHHALQIDRTEVKNIVKTEALPKKTTEELNDRVNELLGHLEGPGTGSGAVS